MRSFERSPVVSEAVDRLFSFLEQHDRGYVLTHETIERVTGLERYRKHWGAMVQRVRKRMKSERHIAMLPERNVGYKLLTKQEQLTVYPEHRRKKQLRQNTMALKAVELLPTDGLSVHQRRLQLMQSDSLRRERKEIRHGLKEQRLEGRPTPTNPRPVPRGEVA